MVKSPPDSLKCLLLLLIVFGLASLAACRSEERDLPFQTITEGEDVGRPLSPGYLGKEPNLLIITTPAQVDEPRGDVQLGSDLADQLRAIDYSNSFAVVVLRGHLGGLSSDYTVDIQQVTRSGSRVVLRTHFGVPKPGSFINDLTSSPYHAIAISKEGAWAQEIQFLLKVDERTVKELPVFVP
jgi:hypothetical protein